MGLRGYVLDSKFGPTYDVTQPLILTRIRQDVSAGKLVEAVIPPSRIHTSCFPQVISASASIADLLHRGRTPWILEHPCDSRLWGVPKFQTLAQPRTAWALAFFFSFLGHRTENERLETWTAETCTVLLANVLEQEVVAVFQDKTCPSKKLTITLRGLSFT